MFMIGALPTPIRDLPPGRLHPSSASLTATTLMRANAGTFWRANYRQPGLVFIREFLAGAPRVTARHSAKPVSL
jgi:hypothetical protein